LPEELILELLKEGGRIPSEAQLLPPGFMTDIKFRPKATPRRHAGRPELRWRRCPQAGPERRDQPHLTPNHGAGGSDLPTRDATLVIPGRAEKLLQIIVRPGQTWKAIRREEVRSVTPADLQEVPERLRERAGTARFLLHPLQHPVELTFNRFRGVVAEICQDLSGLQYEAVGRLDLRPGQLFMLKRPMEVTVQ